MDRLAAQVIATAVLTAALAAVPAAMATPTSDPSTKKVAALSASVIAATPSPSASLASSASLALSQAASTSASASTSVSTSASVEPKSSPTQLVPCADAYQVGNTVYARWHGIVAFSVKQFYSPSCRAVYGYAFPWLQFRLLKAHYDLGMAVFDVTHDAIDGARTFVGGEGGPDFWSSPVSVPTKTCTEGLAHVFFPDTETDTYTAKYCQ